LSGHSIGLALPMFFSLTLQCLPTSENEAKIYCTQRASSSGERYATDF
jgi:hypothetical protein